jgi:hypothetical protein
MVKPTAVQLHHGILLSRKEQVIHKQAQITLQVTMPSEEKRQSQLDRLEYSPEFMDSVAILRYRELLEVGPRIT